MPEARLSIEIPEGAWVRDISKKYPDAVFRVLSAFAGVGDEEEDEKEHGVGIVEVEADGNIADIVRDISEHDAVADVELLWTDEKDALVEFRTRRPMMLLAARRSNIPVRMPFEIRDGVGNWELTAQRERLSELGTVFDSMGVSYEVERVHRIRSEDFLTHKQREVIETALEMGYYDTPREASLSEVAEECGIAKSTCSETLHRAEERIIKDFYR
ncbi:MAG: helix-turn-helix domain-containing protein [Halobacteriales archaeon]|nr:helix-turn-helix domain-containing protein [Halobacteriales archaeon]